MLIAEGAYKALASCRRGIKAGIMHGKRHPLSVKPGARLLPMLGTKGQNIDIRFTAGISGTICDRGNSQDCDI